MEMSDQGSIFTDLFSIASDVGSIRFTETGDCKNRVCSMPLEVCVLAGKRRLAAMVKIDRHLNLQVVYAH